MTRSSISTTFLFICIACTCFANVTTDMSVHCNTAFECSNQTVEATNAWFNGYKTASGLDTTIKCTDQHSACYGAYSCYDIKSILRTQMWCIGSNSCTSAVISTSTVPTSDNFIICQGFLSCAHSHISTILTIWGLGAYSLYNTTINTSALAAGNHLYLYLSGYKAGLNAKLVCGTRCFIYCPQSACEFSHVDCTRATLCDWTNPNDVISYPHFEPVYHYLRDITMHNDPNCNEHLVSTSFDDANTLFTDIYLNGSTSVNICCRGESSCSSITIHHATSQQNVIASGESSFRNSSLYVVGALFCSGRRSCSYSLINIATNVYCLAGFSCEGSMINQVQSNLSCIGAYSCQSSTVFTSGDGNTHYIYFMGYGSGNNAIVYCSHNDRCSFLCGGSQSCMNTIVVCGGICNITCSDYSLCPVVQTSQPSALTLNPSYPTTVPSLMPSIETSIPSFKPTEYPTILPSTSTLHPTSTPTLHPTSTPMPTLFTSKHENDDIDETSAESKPNDLTVILYVVVAVVAIACCMICVCCVYCRHFVPKRKARDDVELVSEAQNPQRASNDEEIANTIYRDMKQDKVTDEGVGLPAEYNNDNVALEAEEYRGEGAVQNNHHVHVTKRTDDFVDTHNIQTDEFVIKENDEQ